MNYPQNGYQLLQARKDGLKPRGVVLVTDSEYKSAPCQLIVKPAEKYDFSMLRGLDVFVVVQADLSEKGRKWRDYLAAQIKNYAREVYVLPSGFYWG
jgi:hypothetical protein